MRKHDESHVNCRLVYCVMNVIAKSLLVFDCPQEICHKITRPFHFLAHGGQSLHDVTGDFPTCKHDTSKGVKVI